eukprot:comp9141_c0_seq1/m.10457 comp9141_c0_seq1/g.10457  ORF comp9141_c0_seq1/g.10457 comp9141_c0_seq1/m.10457 type:complete len:180 (-) comp9141_c0_seq1:67-606(-)
MRLEHCSFCGSTVYPGHGQMFVRNDCRTMRFCRPKCRKNYHMKRNPRKLRWTKAYRKANGKEMALDPAFNFEAKRNRIGKYDREVMAQTIFAMKRIADIRSRRETRFWTARMRASAPLVKKQTVAEIARDKDVLRVPTREVYKATVRTTEKERKLRAAAKSAGEVAKQAIKEGKGMELD